MHKLVCLNVHCFLRLTSIQFLLANPLLRWPSQHLTSAGRPKPSKVEKGEASLLSLEPETTNSTNSVHGWVHFLDCTEVPPHRSEKASLLSYDYFGVFFNLCTRGVLPLSTDRPTMETRCVVNSTRLLNLQRWVSCIWCTCSCSKPISYLGIGTFNHQW